ncbi:hypothetical protein J6590_105891, partial [Homalodisca vitripennis]
MGMIYVLYGLRDCRPLLLCLHNDVPGEQGRASTGMSVPTAYMFISTKWKSSS